MRRPNAGLMGPIAAHPGSWRRSLALAFGGLLLLGFGLGHAAAQSFETRAQHALLMDAETETILFQKAAEERMPPASMAKLMTVAVVFDAIKSGKLSLDTEFQVSENAWRNGGANSGGSTMFAKLGSTIKVGDLLKRHHHPVGQ